MNIFHQATKYCIGILMFIMVAVGGCCVQVQATHTDSPKSVDTSRECPESLRCRNDRAARFYRRKYCGEHTNHTPYVGEHKEQRPYSHRRGPAHYETTPYWRYGKGLGAHGRRGAFGFRFGWEPWL